MAAPRTPDIARLLRQRILRALQIGAIARGHRLPSTREVAEELRADPRVIAAAYRELERDGLVELRPRSGVFAAGNVTHDDRSPALSPSWMASVLAAGIARGVSARDLGTQFTEAMGRATVRVVVIASTVDQVEGLARELREDFGFQAKGVLAEVLQPRRELPRVVHRAHLLVTTGAHGDRVASIATRLRKPHVVMSVRLDLFETEWGAFRGHPAYVIVADSRFGAHLRDYLAAENAGQRVQVLLAGRDDLRTIPADAIVYATQAARQRIGALRLPPGILPPARTISETCAREILEAALSIGRARSSR